MFFRSTFLFCFLFLFFFFFKFACIFSHCMFAVGKVFLLFVNYIFLTEKTAVAF